jgi:hypothetical protein
MKYVRNIVQSTKARLAIKALIVLALLVSNGASAQTGQIQFEISPVTTCSGAGICNSVTEYRVYSQGSTVALASSNSTTTQPVPFQMDVGTEYCFEATAFNGLESARSQSVCYTPTAARPDEPVIINLNVTFSGN